MSSPNFIYAIIAATATAESYQNACERHYTRLSLMFSLILFGRVLFNGGYLAHTHAHIAYTRKESEQLIESERMGTRTPHNAHVTHTEREKAYGRVCEAYARRRTHLIQIYFQKLI